MRLGWQCPTCFAELGNREHAKVITCPFCGSLLVVDTSKKKFYLVKNENSWYYFPKKYIGSNSGYLKFGEHEIYFSRINEKWMAEFQGVKYGMDEETCATCENGEFVGDVEYIWGELPILALPKMKIQMCIENDELCIIGSRGSYLFRKV